MLDALYRLILMRRDTGADTSYVKKLFQRGQDVMCKKVAEEAAEVLLASKNGTEAEIVYEMADLWFHALVLLGHHTIHPHGVLRELQRRFGQPGGGSRSRQRIPRLLLKPPLLLITPLFSSPSSLRRNATMSTRGYRSTAIVVR